MDGWMPRCFSSSIGDRLAISDLSSGMMGDIAGETGLGGVRSKLKRVECRITFTRGDALSSLSSLLNH